MIHITFRNTHTLAFFSWQNTESYFKHCGMQSNICRLTFIQNWRLAYLFCFKLIQSPDTFVVEKTLFQCDKGNKLICMTNQTWRQFRQNLHQVMIHHDINTLFTHTQFYYSFFLCSKVLMSFFSMVIIIKSVFQVSDQLDIRKWIKCQLLNKKTGEPK